MKNSILALALSLVAFGASADPRPYAHYHDNGRVVIGNTISPEVRATTETDSRGRQVRVTTTTRCVDSNVNRRNNHLTCREEETRVEREVVDRRGPNYGGNYGNAAVEPRVQRFVERDSQGRRVIVTVTDTCERAGYNRGQAVCYAWDRTIDRDTVRWNRDRNRLDLDGDGQTNQWERALYNGFREVLESN